ncbi:MAG: beta-lactamase family protein [Cytophagales bacterium]|nr:beta-lactamase family protein [Cytophagales bacterium]
MKKLFIILFVFACNVQEPVRQIGQLTHSTPEREGVSSDAILNFIETAEKEQPDALHSLMILRHGKVIAEGWWTPYNPETPHWLYSLSKSFASTAIGLAIDEGVLSLNDQVISFFPDKLPEEPSENLKNMRIRDLLTMNTGHQQDGSRAFRSASKDWVKSFLALDVEHKPGTKFTYNSGATYMLSAILQKKTGQTLVEYLKPRLFEPLDIKTPTWQSDPLGINVGGWGLSLTTSDIAKFGQLYLQKGNWNGRQIIPEAWIDLATSLQTSNGSNPESDWDQGYGYQFWRCRYNNYRGDGAFGQYCIIMPEKHAVIAITAGSGNMQGILDLVWDHLLPAMKDDPLPDNEDTYHKLQSKLKSLKLAVVEGNETGEMAEEVSGTTYLLNENDQQLKSIRFDLSGREKSYTIQNSEGAFTIPVGYQAMLTGTMRVPFQGELATAASGAWTEDKTYQVKVYNYETPHAITYNFTFNEDEIIIGSEFNVFFGNKEQPEIRGKRE